MAITSKLRAAYLAGFIDGEGYLGIMKCRKNNPKHNTPYYKSVLKVASTDKDIILWLKDSFGGYTEKRVFKNTNQNDAYSWVLSGAKLSPFLMAIQPYLRIKKKQAEIILKREKMKLLLKRYGGKIKNIQSGYGGHRQKIEELYLEIRKLNKRGKN